MVFSSTVFLFAFLPLVLALVYFGGRTATWRNIVLVCASFIFYAWGETWVVFPLFFVAWVNYIIAKKFLEPGKPWRKQWLWLGMGFDLSLLLAAKYSVWLLNGLLNAWFTMGLMANPIVLKGFDLPLGISFFTFQAVSYLVDVYRGDTKPAQTYINFSCYLTMFSQLVAGPIVRYEDIAEEIPRNNVNIDRMYLGVRRFVLGLAKKVLIANQMAILADFMFALDAAELGMGAAWLGAFAYALQIYFDFSAYSDMAIGLGHMFGFRFMENFRHPYASLSIQDFWRRWHISLSTWFRDYVYIPLGGSRAGALQTCRNLVIVFFLCGLWHGAALNFVLWGLWHGTFLVLERAGLGRMLEKTPRPARRSYVWLVMLLGWVMFRAKDMQQAILFYSAMFGVHQPSASYSLYWLFESPAYCILMLIAFAGSLGLASRLYFFLRERSFASVEKSLIFEWSIAVYGAICLVASTALLLAGSYNPFIYFRF